MPESLACFKAYDIRGRMPDELNETVAYRLGRAFGERYRPSTMVLGRDVRPSGPGLVSALAIGLAESGTTVLDLGLCGTEEVYWGAQQPGVDGGIMVTASHNPLDYNGMKLVRGGAVPVSGDSGLREIERMVAKDRADLPPGRARITPWNIRADYAEFLLRTVDVAAMKPLKVVTNAGHGTAGLVVDALSPTLPLRFTHRYHEPDPTFPAGIPNPLLPGNRQATADAVRASGADFGVAWDGDFDRCFFFDERGRFVEGYYLVGLLAEAMLRTAPGATVIHDPRLVWNTVEMVTAAGGKPVQSKTGHAFIKERMRQEDAVYGGEMSAHHYFREFAYCDNGTIPWLLVAQLCSMTGEPLSRLVDDRMARYPVSGEINRRVADAAAVLAGLAARYAPDALAVDWVDGLSCDLGEWRFNLRASNTEPLLRLNVESRGQQDLMQAKTLELLSLIDGMGSL